MLICATRGFRWKVDKRNIAVLFSLITLITPTCLRADETITNSDARIVNTQRTLWTTSRVVGSPEPPPPYTVQRVFPNLKFESPVHLRLGPGKQRYYLSEYNGRIVSFVNDQDVRKTDTFLEVDMHIFSMEFHPHFDENPYVYVFGNTALKRKEGETPNNQVLRFDVSRVGASEAVLESRKVILKYPSDGHNGGEAKFGPDGYLYISSGDGTSDSDGWNTGQDVTDFPGSMLRIDVDRSAGGIAYGIPEDNPLLDVEDARAEIWAYGFRNPWRFSFDHKTGNLYLGDVGQDLWEMIYLVRPGGNYGWSVKEGKHDFQPYRKRGPTPIVPPLIEHHHTEARSITGGFVYRGSRLPDLDETYIYGDYETGIIWGLRHEGDQVTWHKKLANVSLKVASFGIGADEEFFLIDYQKGELYELVPAPQSDHAPLFPRRLSETGLFSSIVQHTPAVGLIPYTVNSAQWMDGADVQRYIALPGDSQITFSNSRAWEFPNGAVLVKTIKLPSEQPDRAAHRLETQILTRQSGEWRGYSYIWNDEQTDAVLAPAKGEILNITVKDAVVPHGKHQRSWRVVGRSECMVCHARAAGYVLGLSSAQMNCNYPTAVDGDNQLLRLEQLGVFTKPLPETPDPFPRLADPYDQQADLSARARSYLHANCSHCHVDSGGGNAKIVLTSQTKLAETFLVGGRPLHADFGIAGAMLVAPNDPERSVLYQRVSRRGNGQMPPLATNRIDKRAVDLIHNWIMQLEVPESARGDVDRAFAEVQGESGTLSRWYVTGPFDQHPHADAIAHVSVARPDSLVAQENDFVWQTRIGKGVKCRIRLTPFRTPAPGSIWLARSDVIVYENCQIELSTDVSGTLRVWLNGEQLDPKDDHWQHHDGANRFDANLMKGRNRVLLEVVSATNSPAVFEAGFRRKSSNSQHEEYTMAALSQTGDTTRGRRLFLDSQKTQCSKCHQIDKEGGQVGPDLTGVGSRLSTARLIESILEPSRTVAPNYCTVIIALESGRILTGVVVEETPETVIVKNDQAKKLVISKSEILQMKAQQVSLMPEGLVKSITKEEFVDLISYLGQLTSSVDSPKRVISE